MKTDLRARALEAFYAAVEIINHADGPAAKHLETWYEFNADLLTAAERVVEASVQREEVEPVAREVKDLAALLLQITKGEKKDEKLSSLYRLSVGELRALAQVVIRCTDTSPPAERDHRAMDSRLILGLQGAINTLTSMGYPTTAGALKEIRAILAAEGEQDE